MTVFDDILARLTKIFNDDASGELTRIRPILVNRDLNGRVGLIVDHRFERDPERKILDNLSRIIQEALGAHAAPGERGLFFEPDMAAALEREAFRFSLEGIDDVYVVDRLVAESCWSTPTEPSQNAPRVAFYSIKGGVGRTTALAATAWALAERGQRVLVLDLDLESPGLSTSLLPVDRRPKYGITDWLVEDLVNNGDVVFNDMVASSPLSHNGEILVVPSHGEEPGEYVAKLGRVWMPKAPPDGNRESWAARLGRLVNDLETNWRPDLILIDSRAGIDEVASACLTNLNASLILLFALEGDQTWSGYRILFRHWRIMGVARKIRERLQVVAAMAPEVDTEDYLVGLRERSWDLFTDELYDEIPANESDIIPAAANPGEQDAWNFDVADESAPHYPWAVRWNRGFAALQNLHGRLREVDRNEMQSVFGPVTEGVAGLLEESGENHEP